MGGSLRQGYAILAAALALSACSGGDKAASRFPEECVLPSPDRDVDMSLVDDRFVLPGSVVRQVLDEDGLLVIALNVPFGVTESLERYKDRLGPPEYSVVSEDNEGFEAELYLRDTERGNLLAVQIRQPRCTEASGVFVQVDNRER